MTEKVIAWEGCGLVCMSHRNRRNTYTITRLKECLIVGTMGEEKPEGVDLYQGKLYRFSNISCKLEPVIHNVSISNGIAWGLDNRYMYFIDTPSRTVERFNYNINTGEISKCG